MTVRSSLLVLTVLLAGPVSAQTTIETITSWNGTTDVEFFGKPNTATYGQTFAVPSTDNVLQSCSFFLRDFSGGAAAFLSSSGHFGAIPPEVALTSWGSVPTNGGYHYTGGNFVFNNNGDDFGLLSTTGWSDFGTSDLAFEMLFDNGAAPTVIPEPSTILLMGTGMGILLVGIARKRRRQ